MTLSRCLLLCAAIITASGCASVKVAPLGSDATEFGASPRERKLIATHAATHQELASKGLLLQDPRILAYLNGVGAMLVPTSAAKQLSFRFHVLRSPALNALASPTGDIYITLGYLARLENEAQLAFVLGHEVTHVVRRHQYASIESERANWAAAKVADVLFLGVPVGQLTYLGSWAAHSREQETEADIDGLNAMASRGYAASEAITALKIVSKKSTQNATGWLDSHPAADERTAELQRQLAQLPKLADASKLGAEAYRSIREALIWEAIQLDLRARKYASATELARSAIAADARSAQAYFYLAESQRLFVADPSGLAKSDVDKARTGDDHAAPRQTPEQKQQMLRDAIAAYETAKQNNPQLMAADKGLGLAFIALGERDKGLALLQSYLSNAPLDPESAYIRRVVSTGGL